MALTAVARAMQDVAATSETAIVSSHHRHLPFQQIQTVNKSVIAPALRGRYAASESTRIPETDHSNRLLKEEKNEIFEAEEQPADSIFDADKYLQVVEKARQKTLKGAEKEMIRSSNDKALKEAEKGNESQPEAQPDSNSGTQPEAQPDSYSGTQPEAQPSSNSGIQPVPQLETTLVEDFTEEHIVGDQLEPRPGPQPDSYPDSYPGPQLDTTPPDTTSVKDEVLDVEDPSQEISSMTPGGKFGVSLAFIAVFAVVSVALRRTCTFGRQRLFQKMCDWSNLDMDGPSYDETDNAIPLYINTAIESDIKMNPTTTSPYTAKTSPSQASFYMYDDETNNGIPLCVNTNTIADNEAKMQELINTNAVADNEAHIQELNNIILNLCMSIPPTQDATASYNDDFTEEYTEDSI